MLKYIKSSLKTVINRDVKGLYAKAEKGLINNMIGISPANQYEPPISPDFVINTEMEPLALSVENFFQFVVTHHRKQSKFDDL